MRDFLVDILRPVTQFGRNLFRLQMGTGPEAQCFLGSIHLCCLCGDGKEQDGLCGTHHGRRRNCRICQEWRHGLFTMPTDIPSVRSDSSHEQLTYDLLQLDTRLIAGTVNVNGVKKRYKKTAYDRRLLEEGKSLCILAGDSKLYELFYEFNSLGIQGLHSSVMPDMLHVVLKGIIEKTVAGALLAVNSSLRLFRNERSGDNAMGLFDFRTSRMASVHNLDWMRWVSFSNGLSQLLKTESRTAAKSDNSTGRKLSL